MTDRITNLILKAQVDQSSADAGVRALQQLQANADQARDSFTNIFKGMSNTAEEVQQLNDVAENVRSTSDALDQATKATNTNAEAVANLNQKYIDAADAAAKLAEAQRQAALSPTDADFGAIDGSGGIGGATGLRRTGSALTQLGLGEIGRPVQLIGDLQQISKEFDLLAKPVESAVDGVANLVGGMAPLGALGLAAAAGVAAVAFVIHDLTEKAKEAQEELKAFGSAAEKAPAIIAKGTQATLDAIGQAATDNAQQGQSVALDIQHIRDRARQGGGALGDQVAGLTDQQIEKSDLLRKTYGDLFTSIDKARQAQKEDVDTFNILSDAVSSGKTAAADATESEKKLRAERDKSAEQSIAEAARLAQLKDTGTSKGVQALIDEDEARKIAIQQQLADASKLSTDEVKKLKDELKQVTQDEKNLTDSILPAVQAREAEDQAVKDAIKDFDKFTKSLDELTKVTAEIGKLESDRANQVKREAETDAINAQRLSIEKDYQTRIDAAKREESEQAERNKVAQADANAQTKYNDDKANIDANFFDSQLKTYQNYIDTEKQSTDRANLQRLQTLEKAQLDLKGLAASGDVAGFVSRSQQAKLDLKNQAENESLADKQRREQFDKQTQAAEEAHQKQLNDLQITFDREKTVRDTAAADRIAQIENSGKEANTRSAQLERELNDIREQWRRDDLKRQRDLEAQGFEERLRLQEDKQREILGKTGDFFNQWVNDIAKEAQAALQAATQATASNTQQSQPPPDDPGILQFATGLDYVPRNNYRASLDLGERVLTAQQNRDYSSGGGRRGGDTYQVTVQNTVGDVATKSMLDEYQSETVGGIKQALRQARGKGSS